MPSFLGLSCYCGQHHKKVFALLEEEQGQRVLGAELGINYNGEERRRQIVWIIGVRRGCFRQLVALAFVWRVLLLRNTDVAGFGTISVQTELLGIKR